MNVFVDSDTHYNHDNIIIHALRTQFPNVTEMNEHLIRVHNERVKPTDLYISLGDFAYRPRHEGHISFDELGARLNGIKVLVKGNHCIERNHKDEDGPKIYEHWMWSEVHDYLEFKFGSSRFVLFHYPIEVWRNAHKGWFHLHGHCHGTIKRNIPHRMDMGVDCWPDFAPVNLEHVRDLMQAQKDYDPQDHHGDATNKTTYI